MEKISKAMLLLSCIRIRLDEGVVTYVRRRFGVYTYTTRLNGNEKNTTDNEVIKNLSGENSE